MNSQTSRILDFLIEDKVILEIKKGTRTRIGDVEQLLMYLRSANKRLGLLAYFLVQVVLK